jgi:signal transduction histidine kinase
MPKLRIRLSYLAIGLMLLLACATLLWVVRARMTEFSEYHRNYAVGAVGEAASQIGWLLEERQRQVALFAEDHRDLLERLAAQPENDALHRQLAQRLRRSFPDYFAFVLSRASGEPYWFDFDGYVGEICVTDIKAFAGTRVNRARIHPNPVEYHYDVMARTQSAGRPERILMVSFKPDQLVQKLRAVKVPGHELMLVLTGESNLIEVTQQGARTVLGRDDYRLTQEETGRIVHRQDIVGSHWQLMDFFEPEFVVNHRRDLLFDMTTFLAVFLGVAGVAVWLIGREEAARKHAEAAREDLMAAITHELRTPITSITGSLGLLASGALGALPDKARDLVEIMNRGAVRLRRLVDDMLDARRIATGKLQLKMEALEVSALVNESLLQNAAYADSLGVRFVRLDALEPTWVMADHVRFEQVMANLLSNAAKYSPRDGTVEVQAAITRPGWVRVSVTDHGPGIREEFKKKLFQQYAQDELAPPVAIPGTGLGLHIVKMLITQHGGMVGLDSADGGGSVFYFELPVCSPPATA